MENPNVASEVDFPANDEGDETAGGLRLTVYGETNGEVVATVQYKCSCR